MTPLSRLTLLVVTAILLLPGYALAGGGRGSGGSRSTSSPAPKVDVCHHPGNNPPFVINISTNAVPAHLANHGDWIVSEEIAGDGIDNDCDGDVDEAECTDITGAWLTYLIGGPGDLTTCSDIVGSTCGFTGTTDNGAVQLIGAGDDGAVALSGGIAGGTLVCTGTYDGTGSLDLDCTLIVGGVEQAFGMVIFTDQNGVCAEQNGCLWSKQVQDGGGNVFYDRQYCVEDASATCADLDVDGGTLLGQPVGFCPNDPVPSQPDATCEDAAGNFAAFYDAPGTLGWTAFCSDCAAALDPVGFCGP